LNLSGTSITGSVMADPPPPVREPLKPSLSMEEAWPVVNAKKVLRQQASNRSHQEELPLSPIPKVPLTPVTRGNGNPRGGPRPHGLGSGGRPGAQDQRGDRGRPRRRPWGLSAHCARNADPQRRYRIYIWCFIWYLVSHHGTSQDIGNEEAPDEGKKTDD
jgi:hypothetical protein